MIFGNFLCCMSNKREPKVVQLQAKLYQMDGILSRRHNLIVGILVLFQEQAKYLKFNPGSTVAQW